MNRNTESHFANVPKVGISRSKFDRSHDHKTTFSTGSLIPIYVDTTIMPGDTVKMDMSEVVRMMTPICPVMDDAFMDTYFFFVPYRLIWDHFKRMMGENDTAPWAQTTEYQIPQVINQKSTSQANRCFKAKSLADYMGYPIVDAYYTASVLPFRAYCLIWNEWFRDENLQNPVAIGNGTDQAIATLSYDHTNYGDVTYAQLGGGKPLPVCKVHDYFTSALPQAQKGNPVYVPLGKTAPVLYGESDIDTTGWTEAEHLYGKEAALYRHNNIYIDEQTIMNLSVMGKATPPSTSNDSLAQNEVVGLYTDLSQAVGATVNQLRQAFAVQKFYERQAYGGTRYIEMVKAHFNVTNPDYRMQRPEYLGGKRIPINVNQVIQSTPTDGTTTPLGTTGAFSVTADRESLFTHSFTEHGILMGLCCIRTVHTYQQGLNAQFSKKKFTDFYFPEFANLGNFAILNKEIYMADDNKNDEAFGYQEAWACERYFPNIVTAAMRSSYSQSLDIWHYADDYTSRPYLGDKWIVEGPENVERTLAVQDEDQFFGDFYFKATYTRPMPLYSIPGLIDHH